MLLSLGSHISIDVPPRQILKIVFRTVPAVGQNFPGLCLACSSIASTIGLSCSLCLLSDGLTNGGELYFSVFGCGSARASCRAPYFFPPHNCSMKPLLFISSR